jgi:hypothetical protein
MDAEPTVWSAPLPCGLKYGSNSGTGTVLTLAACPRVHGRIELPG